MSKKIQFCGWIGIGLVLQSALAGCSLFQSWFPTSGPTKNQVLEVQEAESPIPVIDATGAIAQRLLAAQERRLFSETLGDRATLGQIVGRGDMVEVSVWEAPPAVLFGTTVFDSRGAATTARVTTFPEQMVNIEGTINIPFAGAVPVDGKTTRQIEADIARRLTGKANLPQVLVRITRNNTANVTIMGEVVSSLRMPLTAKGERLLDALAAAGGVRQPVGKMTIRITRDGQATSLPLETVIQDPKQNIALQPGDVVTALHQPLSITAFGATGKNEELYFEAQGISLAQALARIGGVQDNRANAQGVFLFRFEDPAVIEAGKKPLPRTSDGRVPVVYRLDLTDPRTFFLTQNFPVRDKDVVYVANAPVSELQKFLNILTSMVFTIYGVKGFGL